MRKNATLLALWLFCAAAPLVGMGAANQFDSKPLPVESPKRGNKRFCYLRFSPGVVAVHGECGKIQNEMTCRGRPQCKWLPALHQCSGELHARCMRDVARHCDDSEFSDKELHELPNSFAKIYACDDRHPEQSLFLVK